MAGFISSIALWHRLGHPPRGISHLVDCVASALSHITVCRTVIRYSEPPLSAGKAPCPDVALCPLQAPPPLGHSWPAVS